MSGVIPPMLGRDAAMFKAPVALRVVSLTSVLVQLSTLGPLRTRPAEMLPQGALVGTGMRRQVWCVLFCSAPTISAPWVSAV